MRFTFELDASFNFSIPVLRLLATFVPCDFWLQSVGYCEMSPGLHGHWDPEKRDQGEESNCGLDARVWQDLCGVLPSLPYSVRAAVSSRRTVLSSPCAGSVLAAVMW